MFVGTDANPADVEDLGGTSVEAGGSISRKALTRGLARRMGGAVATEVNDRLPSGSVTGEVVIGENGIRGLQAGLGVSAGDVGTTYDASVAVTEPTILYEDTVENPFQ